MTLSNNIGRGRKSGSKNKKKVDPSQKKLNSFLMMEANNQSDYSLEEASTSESHLPTENSDTEPNTASGQDFNASFVPLDDDSYAEEDNEDQDILPLNISAIQREEEDFLQIVDGSPIDELTKKVLDRLRKGSNRGKAPFEYTEGKTFWVTQGSPSFNLNAYRNQGYPRPDVLYIPRLFLWFPQYLLPNKSKLSCPKCDGNLNVKGFHENARRIVDVNDSFYMLSSRYVCSKDSTHGYSGYDSEVIRQLPYHVQSDFPALLTHRSGISTMLVDLLRPLMQNSVGPGRLHKIVRELHHLRYDKLQYQYLSAAYSHKSHVSFFGTGQASEFSEFHDKKGYSGSVPSASYIGYVYSNYMDNIEERINSEMMKLGGVILKGDHTFKIIKKIAQLNGVSIFNALYTLCNEFEEIRMMVLASTKSLPQLEESFTQMIKTYLANQQTEPKVFYTDNVFGDQQCLERWIPSLTRNVVHTNDEIQGNPNLPQYNLPEDVTVIYLQNRKQMDLMASRILDHLLTDLSTGDIQPIYVGFDCEWNVKLIRTKTVVQKVSLIQIAYQNNVYLFHLKKGTELTRNLKTLIESNDVTKIGRRVKQDLVKLSQDYELSKDTFNDAAFIELSTKYMELGYIDSLKGCSLQSLCGDILGKYLPKPKGIRCGDWESQELTKEQRDYAAIDAHVALCLHQRMGSLPQLNCIIKKPVTVETYVNLYATASTCRGRQLAIGKVVEGVAGCEKCLPVKIVKVSNYRATAPICRHNNRSSDRNKRTFEAIKDELSIIHVDIRCLRTTRTDVENEAQMQEVNNNIIPTLVLKDAFHLMDFISVSEKHGMHKEFMARFRDALFVINQEDKRRVTEVLVKQKTSWEEMSKKRPLWISKRIRRTIPPAKELYPVIMALFHHYGDTVCVKTGQKLFDKECKLQALKILDAISKGHVSDPKNVPLYYIRRIDEFGLAVYRCVRGTNSLEGGVHTNIIRKFSMYNASPKFTNCLLADYRLRHNTDVGSLNRYNIKHSSHYNPWLTQGINHLKSELGFTVKGSYYDPDGNAIHFDPKGETFGICPLSDFSREYFGMLHFEHYNCIENEDNSANTMNTAEYTTDSDDDSLVTQVLKLCALPLIKAIKLNISQYEYLASRQNVKYAIVPIHTDEERILFWRIYDDLKMHEKKTPDFVAMTKEWCKQCNVVNEKLNKNQQPKLFYKIPEVLEAYINKHENNSIYKNSTKVPENAQKIKEVKNVVDSSKRPTASFPPAILPSPLRNNDSVPLSTRKRKSNIGTDTTQLEATTNLVPIISNYAVPEAKKSKKRSCVRCAAIDPANVLECPGNQYPDRCKHALLQS